MTEESMLDSMQQPKILSSPPFSVHLRSREGLLVPAYWSELPMGIKWYDEADHSRFYGAEIKSPWSSSSPSHQPTATCLIKHRDTACLLPSKTGRARVANW